ncbi:MAG: hypothetical protein O7B26_07510, partial [Planctomycetota bacterium]|nr:hypothetical protein [Planctomycetota bacterium]
MFQPIQSSHLKHAWVPAFLFLCSTACQVSDGPWVSDQPGFSELAGRWSISYPAMYRSTFADELPDEFPATDR